MATGTTVKRWLMVTGGIALVVVGLWLVWPGLLRGVWEWIEDHPGARAALPDQLDAPVQMDTGFHLHCHQIRPGLDEIRDIAVGVRDHQVDVEGQAGRTTDSFHHQGTHGDIGDEVPVHDVDMDPVGTGVFHGLDFLPQPCKIGGENGGGD